MVLLRCFPSGPALTNTYVVADHPGGVAAIIDPASGSSRSVLTAIKEDHLTVQQIWITHSHWDHIVDAAVLAGQLQVGVWVHQEDAGNLREPGSDGLPLRIPVVAVEPSHFFSDGDELGLGSLRFKVIHTPGHTPGGVCFYEQGEGILFSGDTLFRGSIGNLSFPTSEPERMWSSLDQLAKLPPDTTVYPGHGEPTTIGRESWLSRAREHFG
jgi:hydroxyacylglutathione hydrolase